MLLPSHKSLAQTISCGNPPSQIPLLGTFPINCVVQANFGPFDCIGAGRKIVTKVKVYYYKWTGGRVLKGSQAFECDSSTCITHETSIAFDEADQWAVEFCGVRECQYYGTVDIRNENCLPYRFFQVLPPRCGDGVINQPGEECDPPGGNCDNNCRLIGTGGSSQPTQPTGYDNPLLWADIPQFLLYALRFIFNVLLGVSILMIVIAGIFLAASRGDPIRQAKGKRTLLFAVLGFAIASLAQGLFMLFKIIFGVRF